MLDALRKASERWFGRALMGVVLGVIVFSFVIWGIGDMFRGFGSDTLAKVGGRTITAQEFRTAYTRQLNQLQQQQRRPITAQEAQAMGLDAQVLSSLIADEILDVQAGRLGLGLADKEVAAGVLADPAFKGPNGQFDSSTFSNLLQQNGLTEAQYVVEQRDLDLRREIADALLGGLTPPAPMLDAVDAFRNETRSIESFTLPASAVEPIQPPTDKALETWFNSRREEWRAPEYRSLVVLSITPSGLADPKDVSDATARKVYDANRSAYGDPEKRTILQATFPTEADAQGAVAKIRAGEDFTAASKQAKGAAVDLGSVQQSGLFDPAVAKIAFSTPAGGIGGPAQGRFGWVVTKTTSVTPATIKPFTEVEAQIKQSLAQAAAVSKVAALREKIEDQRTSGKTLTQAAQSLGLKTQTIGATDAQGLGKNGEPVALPDKTALLKAAFASDVGMDNDVLAAPDGGDVWFEVSNVEPAHDRPFSEAKPQALAAWTQDEIGRRLAEKARVIVTAINGGESLADAAKAYGAALSDANDLKRIGTTSEPPAVVAQAFNTPVHGAASAAPDATSRVIFQVMDSVTPPVDPGSKVNQAIVADLKQQMSDDVLGEYLNALQASYGVSVNQGALASVVTGSAQP